MASLNAPLVLTLTLDADSFAFFNRLRQQYFPPERNFLEAHLTLFHHLPAQALPTIQQHLALESERQQPLPLQVTGVRMIGRGVAYTLESMTLMAMRERLARQWKQWLTPQDQQKLWPHITVQNKVSPTEARALHETLKQTFQPFVATGTGLRLWVYRGGPWELWQTFLFERTENGKETL